MITQTKKSTFSLERDDVSMSDRDIIRRYLGIDTLPCKMSSPLREGDVRPSFSMREMNGIVFWKDFGTGESGNAVSLMAKLWNVKYKEALLKIKMDNEGKISYTNLIRKYKGTLRVTKNSTLKVKTRPWKEWDVQYWASYGIPEKFATWCNVFPVSHAFFTSEDENGRKRTVSVPMDKYAYAYFEWKDDKESIKLYQPYSKTMKWLSKHDASVWDLWRQAFLFAEKKSDKTLIITSSRKDAMCLWYNLKVPAIAMQGEGFLPKPQIMDQLFERFKKVYLWYDNDFSHKNDNPGQDNARKLIEMYPKLRNICIPDELQCKDPSDLVKTWGTDILLDIWKEQK